MEPSVSTSLCLAPPVVNFLPEFSPKLRDLLIETGVSTERRPVLIYTKKMTITDVNKGQNRLTISKTEINETFLSVEEETRLWEKEKLPAKVIDPSLNVHEMSLSRWKRGANEQKGPVYDPNFHKYSYSIIRSWMEDVVYPDGIVVGDTLDVWAFRCKDGSLGFIIMRKERQAASSSSSNGSGASTLTVTSWGKKRKRGINSPPMN